MGTRLFRGRRTAAAATATVALLFWMEVSDVLRPGRTGDVVDDRGTSRNFVLATGVAVVVSSIELLRLAPMPRHPRRWWAGLAAIWTGAVINRAARAHLGKNYRGRLTVVDAHEVVTSGPYALVRHPMYTGSCLICAGTALAISSPAAIATWSLPVLSLLYRIRQEEHMLRDALGRDYDRFAASRSRLLPGVW